nr:reverse transcriptase domain-containing protein [Tanacetum cinerariifolium]
MADENIPAPGPTRLDDQILPNAAWVPIGKSNFVLDLRRKQKNPIFQISVDILKNTNFCRAFTGSASVQSIYIQQFWNMLTYKITPIDQAHQFVSPPSGVAIMDFVNQLGYTESIHFVSRMVVNNMYQPWRAILSMINQCLTGKTFGHDRPRYPVLQMLWGIIRSTIFDYAELLWEEFVQAIHTFLTDKANLGSPTKKGRKDKPHVIPYCRFMKLIISKPSPMKQSQMGKVLKTRKRKNSLQLIDEEEPSQPEPEPKPEPEHRGKGKAIAIEEQAAQSLLALHTPKRRSTTDQFILQRQTPSTEEESTGPSVQPQDDASVNIVHESLSPVDAKTGADTDKTNSGGDTKILKIDEDQGKDVDNQVNLEEKTVEVNQGQARSDPEEPLSSSGTLSSMKNLDDAYTFGDQFLDDKSSEDDLGKLNMDSKVFSMVTVPIHQASSSVPPLSTLRDLPRNNPLVSVEVLSKVRSYMRILNVISLKTYVRYGYAFLKEIVLRRADYQEYKISEADIKTLHLNDFKDLHLLHLQAMLAGLRIATGIKYLIVAVDYFTKWLEAKPMASITRKQVKNFAFDNIVCMFRLSTTIITYNETQLINEPVKSWAEGFEIKLVSMSVYHPQANRVVERAN